MDEIQALFGGINWTAVWIVAGILLFFTLVGVINDRRKRK